MRITRNLSAISAALCCSLAAALTPTTSALAADKDYPQKPVMLVVSYPAGGSVDAAARILQEPLGKALGQPIVVENRGGAGGTIATRHVATSKPDGYTVLITLSSHTINPAVYDNLPFDTQADFKPVSLVASAPQVLVAHPSFKPSTLRELLDYAEQSTDPVPYGSAGIGSPSHIAGELLSQKANTTKLMHVPYRGGGPATVDVVSGQIPLLWVSLPSVASFIKSGDLKAIAVSTKDRTPIMPDIPAASETIDDFNVDSWYAMFVPVKTPSEVVDTLYEAIVVASKDPKVNEALAAQGAVAVGTTPAELGEIVKKEIADWKVLAEQANIKIK